MVRYLYINICFIDIYLVSTTFIDISNKNQHGNITNVISLTMPLWHRIRQGLLREVPEPRHHPRPETAKIHRKIMGKCGKSIGKYWEKIGKYKGKYRERERIGKYRENI